MKRKIRNWTLTEVNKVLPLVRSILCTIRNETIAANSAELLQKRLKPSRANMVALCNLRSAEEIADDNIQNALDEFKQLGVFLFDPIQAVAGFPFVKNSMDNHRRKAWFLYTPYGELYWRFDDETAKRDLGELAT